MNSNSERDHLMIFVVVFSFFAFVLGLFPNLTEGRTGLKVVLAVVALALGLLLIFRIIVKK